MESITKYIDECNKAYVSALEAMEQGKPGTLISKLFLDVAQLLLTVAKLDASRKQKCVDRAKMLFDCAKEIDSTKSYTKVYKKLTGKTLKIDDILDNLPNTDDLFKTEDKQINQPKTEKKESDLNFDDVVINYEFEWDSIPKISFDDVAGLEDVKEEVKNKVLIPLKNPELNVGYTSEGGGGLLLYGPPGTGKTMIAAAIAHEINAKFCTVGPSDILSHGVGSSEKKIAQLFKEAHSFDCAVIFFDELESLCPASTRSIISKQIRSELLRQMQGIEDYSKDSDKILFLIGASNKPWDIDSAFLRPGRLGTRIFVGLPDFEARKYIICHTLDKIRNTKVVKVADDIDPNVIAERCNGFNGADINGLLQRVQDISKARASETNNKYIDNNDFEEAFSKTTKSVQVTDLVKLKEWTDNFNAN